MTFASPTQARGPPLVFLPPRPQSPAVLIFIHQYGIRASVFNPCSPNSLSIAHFVHQSPALRHVKIIVPEGLPCKHPSVPGNVWYNIPKPVPEPGDITEFSKFLDDREIDGDVSDLSGDEEDMNVTLDYLEVLIKAEVATGTPINRIVLMGHSQGGCMVTLFLLTRRLASELAAVISYASFSPTPISSIYRMQEMNGLSSPGCEKTKLFMLHGKQDLFVQRGIFDIWCARLQELAREGKLPAHIECRLVEKGRHNMSADVWSHVIKILENTLPLKGHMGHNL